MFKKDEKVEELCESAQHNDDDRAREIIIKRRTKYWRVCTKNDRRAEK